MVLADPAGMNAGGLGYPGTRPALARLAHIRAVLAVRLWVQGSPRSTTPPSPPSPESPTPAKTDTTTPAQPPQGIWTTPLEGMQWDFDFL
ncbi:MAG: hypothetical protein ABSB76_13425 [Streptosporangiaceae bacterium]